MEAIEELLNLLLDLAKHLILCKAFNVVFFVQVSHFFIFPALTELYLLGFTKKVLVMREGKFHAFN